jgi:hypothetical protein
MTDFPVLLPSGVNPYRILCYAHAVALQSGLYDWKIELVDDPVNAGTCTESTRTIALSPRWMTSVEEAHDTILHEIAHALNCAEHHGVGFNATLADLKKRYE